MKKLFNLFAAFLFVTALVFLPKANAADIADIVSDYWAKAEIYQMVNNGIMTLDSNGKFNPNAPVERSAFTSMLIKVLNQSSLDVCIENPFEDVNAKTEFYDDIMRSEQIGLIYGYPDGTFRPENDIVKAEVTSVVSHITKDTIYDFSILDDFTDTDKIPEWAKAAYAKTVKYNLFVNYPDRAKFEPDRDITRAETAVLLAKLQNAISNVKEEYKADEVEKTLSTEHLSVHSRAASNLVVITNMRKTIEEGNILKVSFTEKYRAKNASVGDGVVFVNEKDIVTDEGTLLIPANSKFYASIEDVIEPKILNKSGSIKFNFNRLELENGQTTNMDGKVYNNLEGYLKKSSIKKLAGYTVGGAIVGTGIGAAITYPLDEGSKTYSIGLPCGAAAGFLIGLFTKGSNYTANKGDELYVLLNSPLSLSDSL